MQMPLPHGSFLTGLLLLVFMTMFRFASVLSALFVSTMAFVGHPEHPAERAQQTLYECLAARNVPTSLNSSTDWTSLTAAYNLRLQYTPVAVTLPDTPQHVSDAVLCAAAAGVKVQPRSGGHSYGSYSLGGKNGSMVIDLRKFNAISLDKCKLPCYRLWFPRTVSLTTTSERHRHGRWRCSLGEFGPGNLQPGPTSASPWHFPRSRDRWSLHPWGIRILISSLGYVASL